jgi:hypothetical protein
MALNRAVKALFKKKRYTYPYQASMPQNQKELHCLRRSFFYPKRDLDVIIPLQLIKKIIAMKSHSHSNEFTK